MFTTATVAATSHELANFPALPQHSPSSSTASSYLTVRSYDKVQRSQAERKLVRRLDTFLLPVLILMCCFQAIDKSGLGIAKVNGIEQDLHMSQRQFNIAVAVFQIGYLSLMIPSNLVITKVPPRFYLAGCCFAWSTVAACHCLVHNYQQLIILRVLLGCCDAPYLVGSLHLLSSWYTRRELAKRTSLILGTLIVTMTFSYTISAGIMSGLDGVHGWRGWRWMYLVFGGSGVIVALLGAIFLPNYPETAKQTFWLTEEQQILAAVRMAEDRVNGKDVTLAKSMTGLKLAVKDVRTWIFALMFMSRKSLEGLYYYLPELIKRTAPVMAPDSSLSATNLALLLSAPPALVAAAIAFFLAYTSDKFNERAFHIAGPLGVALVGMIMSIASHDLIVRYVSVYLYLAGSVVGSGLSYAWVANVIQETPEKKAVGIAIVNVVGGLGACYSPFLFRHRDAPEYHIAFGFMAGCVMLDIVCVLTMRWVLGKQNARIQRTANGEDAKLYVR